MAKKRRLEARFLNEWLMMKFPTALRWKRVRVGPLPDKKLGRLMMITLRWADAVVFDGKHVYIIEAKLKDDLGAISQLKNYVKLFPDTPEFQMLRDYPITPILLLPYPWPGLVKAAKAEGIQVEIFKPKWLYEEMGWKWEEEKSEAKK